MAIERGPRIAYTGRDATHNDDSALAFDRENTGQYFLGSWGHWEILYRYEEPNPPAVYFVRAALTYEQCHVV